MSAQPVKQWQVDDITHAINEMNRITKEKSKLNAKLKYLGSLQKIQEDILLKHFAQNPHIKSQGTTQANASIKEEVFPKLVDRDAYFAWVKDHMEFMPNNSSLILKTVYRASERNEFLDLPEKQIPGVTKTVKKSIRLTKPR